jgi:HEAT repeat protein
MAEEAHLIVLALDKTRLADERVAVLEQLAGMESASYDLWRALGSIFNDAEDFVVRVAAVRAMGKRFPAAAPNQLCRYAAGDPSRNVRRAAVAVLEQIGRVPEQTESLLQRHLLALSKEPKSHILLNLAMRYGRDPRALAALRDATRNVEAKRRAIAIQGLGMLGEAHDLINALRDDQPQVRVSAAETLGYYSLLEPAEIAALEMALIDTDEAVRRTAKTALRRLGVKTMPKVQAKREATTILAIPQAPRFAWESLLNTCMSMLSNCLMRSLNQRGLAIRERARGR